MELILEFTFEAELAEPLMIPNAPYGTRVIFPAIGGQAKGDRISGSVVGCGGDWLLIGPDGWGRLDVRAQLRTDDGALLYITYGGVLEMNDRVVAASAPGLETGFDDQYFRTARYAGEYMGVSEAVIASYGAEEPGMKAGTKVLLGIAAFIGVIIVLFEYVL